MIISANWFPFKYAIASKREAVTKSVIAKQSCRFIHFIISFIMKYCLYIDACHILALHDDDNGGDDDDDGHRCL